MTQELYDKLYGAPVTATTQAPAQTRSSDFLKELPTWGTPQSTPSVATGAPAGYVANPIVGIPSRLPCRGWYYFCGYRME